MHIAGNRCQTAKPINNRTQIALNRITHNTTHIAANRDQITETIKTTTRSEFKANTEKTTKR